MKNFHKLPKRAKGGGDKEGIHKVKPKSARKRKCLPKAAAMTPPPKASTREGGNARFDGFVVPPSPLVSPYAPREASFIVSMRLKIIYAVRKK